MQDFCPSFVRSIFFLFQMKIWYLNYLFCCFLQISYYGKIQISRLERSLLLLPTFWMGNLLLFWHSLSQTPGTPILTIVLPALMYYVGFSWWSSFDKEYCQLSVFHLKKKKKGIVSTSSDCVNVWKYSVSHSALDNSWQKENYSFLLNQLFLCCVPAFLALVWGLFLWN